MNIWIISHAKERLLTIKNDENCRNNWYFTVFLLDKMLFFPKSVGGSKLVELIPAGLLCTHHNLSKPNLKKKTHKKQPLFSFLIYFKNCWGFDAQLDNLRETPFASNNSYIIFQKALEQTIPVSFWQFIPCINYILILHYNSIK